MNFQLVSSQAVIENVQRTLKIEVEPLEADMLEWIGEVMEFVAYYPALSLDTAELEVHNYRAQLPSNLVTLGEVWYNNKKLPYGNTNNVYNFNTKVGKTTVVGNIENNFISLEPSESSIKADTYISDGVYTPLDSECEVQNSPEGYYFLQSGYIKTSFESGIITLKYMKYPMDEQGYPMIPDNVYFTQACLWYIMSRLSISGFQFTNTLFNFEYIDRKWRQYCQAASNDLRFPSVEKMENFKDNWLRMITV